MPSIRFLVVPMPFTRYRFVRPSRLSGVTAKLALWCVSATVCMSFGYGADAAPAASDDSGGLEEITVTAEKYTSTIQNTPISISALSGDQLIAAGLTRLEDVAHEVPGLSMRSAGPGLTEYEARGLASNGGAAPTVGFYLDEIPLSPPALSQSGKVVIDPDLYDIERVEVLRGPQGTLYGSGSMGGTIKIITNQPKLGVLEGSAQATGSYTDGGGGNGSANLALNLPVGETLAVRLVLSDLYRSGWIDNKTVTPFPVTIGNPVQGNVLAAPVTNDIKNANDEQLWSARVSVLYKPSDDFSILGTAMQQHLHMGGYDLLDGSPDSATPSRVYDAHYEAFPLREYVDDDISIFGLTVNANVGFADLTTRHLLLEPSRRADAGCLRVDLLLERRRHALRPRRLPRARSFASDQPRNSPDVARQRRPALGGGRLLQRTAFGMERNRSEPREHHAIPTAPISFPGIPTPSSKPRCSPTARTRSPINGKFPPVCAGTRIKANRTNSPGATTALMRTPPAASQITKASDNGFNPRINLSYAPTQDLTTYATVSKGFRPGGANQILPPPTSPPYCQNGALQFGPDAAWNYEVGEKAKLFDNWLTINSDVYYIKWTGIQQVVTLPCGYQYYTNAGDGRSFGPELEINAKLSAEWSASFSGTYTDAKITHPNGGLHQLPDQCSAQSRRGHAPLQHRQQLHGAHHERGQGRRQRVGHLRHRQCSTTTSYRHGLPTCSSAPHTMSPITSTTYCRRTISRTRA